MKAKHTKEFALEKAKEEYPEKFDHSPACINKQSRPPFIKGFMTATEETNHIELLEKAKHILHLHMCEQEGISSGQPTPGDWYKAVNELSEAIRKAEEETKMGISHTPMSPPKISKRIRNAILVYLGAHKGFNVNLSDQNSLASQWSQIDKETFDFIYQRRDKIRGVGNYGITEIESIYNWFLLEGDVTLK